jgi:hypothetical protein
LSIVLELCPETFYVSPLMKTALIAGISRKGELIDADSFPKNLPRPVASRETATAIT